jgi:hypothetical protein
MSRWIHRPSPAMIVACAALLVALGGTSVAAVTQLVPRNSVGTAQLRNNAVATAKIRNNAVTTAKVRNRSLRAVDFAVGQIPAGPAGPTGPAGPAGPAGPFADALPSGRTIRGAFNMGGTATGALHLANTSLSFAFALAAAPTAHFIRQGTAPPAQCPGNATFPQANAGNVCIYEAERANTAGGQVNEVNRSGATIFIFATAGGSNFFSYGTWAVTAP